MVPAQSGCQQPLPATPPAPSTGRGGETHILSWANRLLLLGAWPGLGFAALLSARVKLSSRDSSPGRQPRASSGPVHSESCSSCPESSTHTGDDLEGFPGLSVPSPGPVTLQGSGKPYLVMTNSLGDLELASVIYNQAVLANPHPSHCHCFNPCMEPHCNLGEVAANRTYVNGNIFYRF